MSGALISASAPIATAGNAADAVNDSSLKGYWKLDEASGNATDAKGSNTLTDNGGVTSAAGKVSTARDFTAASTQYLSITDNASVSTGDIDFTVAAWVRYGGTLLSGQYPGIIGKWPGGGQNEFILYLNGDNQRYEFHVSSTGSNESEVRANNFGDPSDGAWHYVIAWHDAAGNTLNIQVDNGTADTFSYSSGLFDGTGAFTIGSIGTAFTWTGQLDEAFITKRVLTAGERTALYAAGAGYRPAGL